LHAFGTETLDEWATAIDINIKGVYILTTAFIAMAKSDATIINVSTAMAHLPGSFRHGFSSYAATKLAGSKIIDYLQAENPALHVVEIHPGQVTETDMARKLGEQLVLPHIDDGTFLTLNWVVLS
jgi:NAD(P)-dependent dehydrogenase (short-subunit alcohol dehydrogenase family)